MNSPLPRLYGCSFPFIVKRAFKGLLILISNQCEFCYYVCVQIAVVRRDNPAFQVLALEEIAEHLTAIILASVIKHILCG